MNAQPVNPNTRLDDFHPARFLKVSDLRDRWKVEQITMTICRVMDEPTIPSPKELDPTTADRANPNGKPRVVMQKVLYFATRAGAEWPAGYLLSAKVDTESLKSATSAETAGELIGKRIIVFVGEHRKQAVLRISPVPPEPEK
jgi:hypothetical protein